MRPCTPNPRRNLGGRGYSASEAGESGAVSPEMQPLPEQPSGLVALRMRRLAASCRHHRGRRAAHHFGATRKADDHTRDRHWDRCGVRTIRIPSEHADDPASLKDLLREDLRRRLWVP